MLFVEVCRRVPRCEGPDNVCASVHKCGATRNVVDDDDAEQAAKIQQRKRNGLLLTGAPAPWAPGYA